MTDDPPDRAEALDEDVIAAVDDRTDDEYGQGLPDYPPDRPVGDNTVGVTAVEENVGESFAERTLREEPESGPDGGAVGDDPFGDVGQLVDPDTMTHGRTAERPEA